MEAAARFAALTRLNLPFFEYTREFYRVRRSDGIGGCHTQFAVLARGQLSFFFVTYTIIQSITSSEMCSLYLTHPSAHTLGAVGTQEMLQHGHRI